MMKRHMATMLQTLRPRAAILALALMLGAACPVSAGPADNEKAEPDARLEGYANAVTLEGGTGGTMVLFFLLTGLTAGVMFMNAKRSHLD